MIGISAAAAGYWWRVTVPDKRVELSRSKKNGEVGELLETLREAEADAEGSKTKGSKRLERWLLNDWVNPSKKEPALPFLPQNAKFNSGDNPIIAAVSFLSYSMRKNRARSSWPPASQTPSANAPSTLSISFDHFFVYIAKQNTLVICSPAFCSTPFLTQKTPTHGGRPRATARNGAEAALT